MDRKKRILWVGEASFLKTGFSVIANEILTRLHKTGKYEIAELGCYAQEGDPRGLELPWKFYGSIPAENNKLLKQRYDSSIYGQFGEAVFEAVSLDWKQSCVIELRDDWMGRYILNSPFRKNFDFIWLLTIDGEPQRHQFIEDYLRCDRVLTYSKYGKDTVERESGGKIKVFGITSPGFNENIFKPLDRNIIREKNGIDKNANILLTVMRNQIRKLYPDLIEAFKKMILIAANNGNEKVARNTFLHLHTSQPDVGHNIFKLCMDSGISHKIYVTYICRACQRYFIDKVQGELAICKHCGNLVAHMPNSTEGVTTEQLAEIYNVADAYIQYSICLGKNEKVLLERGWTEIKDVKVGDMAYTHKHRFMSVLKTFISPNQGNVKEISVFSDDETLTITDNHPVLALTKQNVGGSVNDSLREFLGVCVFNERKIPDPEFVEVKNLQIGDMISFPIDDSIEDIVTIDMADYASERCFVDESTISTWKSTYSRFIEIDEDFCEMIGLFAANGSTGGNSGTSKITCHVTHVAKHDLCKKVFLKIADKFSIRKYKGREAVDIMLDSKIHKNAFKEWCGVHLTKSLPSWTMKLPVEKQKKILKGMFMGDGHFEKTGSNNSLYCTISPILAFQLKTLLRRCRIMFSCKLVVKSCNDGKKRHPQYSFHVSGDIASGDFSGINKRNNTRNLYIDNNHYMQIKEIKDSSYSEELYNFEVAEDNSYVHLLGSLHNCEGFGIPIAEAKGSSLPVFAIDYTAMSEQVSIPGGFPLKPKGFFFEGVTQTEQKRSYADNDLTANELYKFFCLSKQEQKELGKLAREDALKTSTFERSAKIFEDAIDSLEIHDPKTTWFNPKGNFAPLRRDLPNFQNSSDLINWGLEHILGKPELIGSIWANDLLKGLNVGYIGHKNNSNQKVRCDANYILNMLGELGMEHNFWEQQRLNMLKPKPPENSIRWSLE